MSKYFSPSYNDQNSINGTLLHILHVHRSPHAQSNSIFLCYTHQKKHIFCRRKMIIANELAPTDLTVKYYLFHIYSLMQVFPARNFLAILSQL